jgi:hypothetical protein
MLFWHAIKSTQNRRNRRAINGTTFGGYIGNTFGNTDLPTALNEDLPGFVGQQSCKMDFDPEESRDIRGTKPNMWHSRMPNPKVKKVKN